MNTTGKGAGIWESGCGASVDAAGNVYLTTGNSDAANGSDAKTGGFDYSESSVEIRPDGFGRGGLVYAFKRGEHRRQRRGFRRGRASVLLPDQPGSIPHVIICTGKTGEIYVVNRDNMTHFNANNDASIMQVLGVNGGACKGTPVYWNAPAGPHVFIQGENTSPMTMYSVAVGGGWLCSTDAG